MQHGTVDFTWLPESMQAELAELSARLGSPVTGSTDLGDSSYLRRVVERGLVFRKPFYRF